MTGKHSDASTARTDKKPNMRTDLQDKQTDRQEEVTDALKKQSDNWTRRTSKDELRMTGSPSEDELLASSQETVEGKAVGHSTPTTINEPTTSAEAMGQKRGNKVPSRYKLCQRSLAILGRIRKNETEGKVHPKDETDKARCQKVVDEYLAFQAANRTDAKKRNRSHDETGKATKKHKISDQGAVASKPIKRFSEVARDHLQMALVDETSNRGKPVLDKWSEIEARLSRIVVDHVMANPEGQTPGFDSVEVVRGYCVIKCDDQFSLHFLTNVIGKIQNSWEGLKLKLIPASEIPRRPRARIWAPNMEFDANRLIPYLQAHNRSVPMTDWSIIKAEAPQRHSRSFLLLITEESLEPLEKVGNKLQFGIRKTQLKIFRSANPEEEQDEVDGANELLTGMQLDDTESEKGNQ
ncbi:uncharacterized protein LOC129249854 [Anastrepha obliqua]|uniref:uncharacterized protein LOC129249854 n=1 Tax=Anastrepha obliqua TaxID=95512 RepID=UPI0024099F20|nr:uncharacterized protein LOC129249854 [Anastrepha obliqua]